MTQSKLHKIIPFLLVAACLMFCIDTDAQRARNRRKGVNDSVRVDSLGTDTRMHDSVAIKKKEL